MYSGARNPWGLPSTKQKSQWFAQRRMRGGSSVTPIGSPSGRSMSYSISSPRGSGFEVRGERRERRPGGVGGEARYGDLDRQAGIRPGHVRSGGVAPAPEVPAGGGQLERRAVQGVEGVEALGDREEACRVA